MSKNELLFFIHIEKCAGTSINNILARNLPYFAVPKVMVWTNEEKNNFTPKHMQTALKIFPFIQGFGGHSVRPYYNYEVLTTKKVKYFTILRDPVKRYLSQYNYNRIELGRNLTIDEFLSEERFTNFQTKKIAGEEDLKKAIDILDKKMSFVGLVEKFDDLLVLLSTFLPKNRNKIAFVSKNKTPKQKKSFSVIKFNDLTDYQKARVLNNNALDIELYNYVLENLYPKQYQLIQSKNNAVIKEQYTLFDELLIIFNKIFKRVFKIVIDKIVLNRY